MHFVPDSHLKTPWSYNTKGSSSVNEVNVIVDIRKVLNIEIDSPFWEEAHAKAQATSELPDWLTDRYIADLERDFSLFGSNLDLILQALCQVRETPALCQLAKILCHIIGKKRSFSQSFSRFSLPKSPEHCNSFLGYHYVGLFPILAHVRPFCLELAERGITADIMYDTLSFLRANIQQSFEQTELPRFGKSFFSIFRVYIYTNFLWIGRLRFEIHPDSDRKVKAFADSGGNIRLLMCDTTLHASGAILGAAGCTDEAGAFDADFLETENYYEGYAVNSKTHLAEATRIRLAKSDWTCILQPGDTLLKVHIPSKGRLLKADCDAAYERAKTVFQNSYPEYVFKGFICNSWLLCPTLASFLRKDSNIVLFQETYHIFPAKNTATDVFLYVFGLEVSSADELDLPSLPEGNSLQRGVKKLLLEGTYFHQFNGFIPF